MKTQTTSVTIPPIGVFARKKNKMARQRLAKLRGDGWVVVADNRYGPKASGTVILSKEVK